MNKYIDNENDYACEFSIMNKFVILFENVIIIKQSQKNNSPRIYPFIRIESIIIF